jgi:hypothetical protein
MVEGRGRGGWKGYAPLTLSPNPTPPPSPNKPSEKVVLRNVIQPLNAQWVEFIRARGKPRWQGWRRKGVGGEEHWLRPLHKPPSPLHSQQCIAIRWHSFNIIVLKKKWQSTLLPILSLCVFLVK